MEVTSLLKTPRSSGFACDNHYWNKTNRTMPTYVLFHRVYPCVFIFLNASTIFAFFR